MRAAPVLLVTVAVALRLPRTGSHSVVIVPKPRNAVDADLPQFAGGTCPMSDGTMPAHGRKCDVNTECLPDGALGNTSAYCGCCFCVNGTSPCLAGQTCFWFSQGCTIGCPTCTGRDARAQVDVCGRGMKPTVCDPRLRTYNQKAPCGSKADVMQHNPWRAPGTAPVFDVCGKAGGGWSQDPSHGGKPGPGDARFTDTVHNKNGDLGSKVLKKMPSQATWRRGEEVETMWGMRANHGGGIQYRLCPATAPLTEECMQRTPVPFVGRQELVFGNGSRQLVARPKYAAANGTGFFPTGRCPGSAGCPEGATWALNPVPDGNAAGIPSLPAGQFFQFPPPCSNGVLRTPPGCSASQETGQGVCSGERPFHVAIADYLRVPAALTPGSYVLGFRWDAEETAQVWSACSDIRVV